MNSLFRSADAGVFGRRLRHARGARIPVTVVTGFLGAGKTTLVKRFLESEEGRGTALVVNEFGEAGIDDVLLRESADETRLLGNGCLCCNVRSDLQEALRRLVSDRERGRVLPFRQVLIETSGLADPGPILSSFATDRALGGEYHLETVMAVVDAVNGAATLDRFSEARRQVLMADSLVVTKSDLVPAMVRETLAERLRSLNPRARIVNAEHGEIDPALFVSGDAGSPFAPEFTAIEALHSDNVRSFTLTFEKPIRWAVVARAMDTLLAMRGSDILRAKGLLNIDGCRGPVVVQFVQHLAHPPAELQDWPDEDRRSRLVFIVQDLSEGDVRSLFEAVQNLTSRGA